MIELSALGSGRVLIDDQGITRERMFREPKTLTWDEIETYHLTMKAGVESSGFFDVGGGHAIWKYGIELRGGDTRIELDWAFEAASRVIAELLRRLHEPMTRATRRQLRETGAIVAGDLTITADMLSWVGELPLPLDQVEAIEFFDSSPVHLRVMKHHKVFPHAKCPMGEIGNVIEVLEAARELGYPVRGTQLFDGLRSAGP